MKTLVLAVGPVLKRQLMPAIVKAEAGFNVAVSGIRDRARPDTDTEHEHDIRQAARAVVLSAEVAFQAKLMCPFTDTHAVAELLREGKGRNLERALYRPDVLISDATIWWPNSMREL